MTTVLISLLGVLNGLTIGLLRLPELLIEKRFLGKWNSYFPLDENKQQQEKKILVLTLISLSFWTLLHFIITKWDLLHGGDISEISIVFSYVAYIPLYICIWKMKEIRNPIRRFLIPCLALLGSLIILIGSIMMSPLSVIAFLLLCFAWCGLAYALQEYKN